MSSTAERSKFGSRSLVTFVGSAVVAVARRPWLIPTAVRQGLRLAPSRWWARRPFLPVPDAAYMRFRSETLSGDPNELPDSDELVVWLEWCRSIHGLPAA